jgi:hypothetical protein
MNFRRRLTSRRIQNLCKAHVLDAEREPKRCTNRSSRFSIIGQQRIWLCDEHVRIQLAGNMAVVERRDQQVVLVDCREKGKSDGNQKVLLGQGLDRTEDGKGPRT